MEGADAPAVVRRTSASLRRLAPRALRRHESVEDVFERFYRKHVAEVYQYALALLGNPADAEDATQQTFLNAYRAFQRGGRPTKPHNWLIKIAHNVCRMRWRQLGRRPQEVPLDAAPEPAARDDEKPSLDEVLNALARLPLNQRAAIVMREVEDRSYAEIADVLGVTVPAVEALLFRARTTLRTHRKTLTGTLGVAPLPSSLGSFFGGGGGLVAAGGAALGSEIALKAAAVVATTAVAGGLGYKAVNAVARPEAAPAAAAALVRHDAKAPGQVTRQSARAAALERRAARVASFHHAKAGVAKRGRLRSAPTNDRRSATAPVAGEPAAAAAPGPGQAAPASTTVANTVGGVASTAPPVPTVPPLPPPPPPVTVSTPVTTVSVTVPTVTLPPPPGLK